MNIHELTNEQTTAPGGPLSVKNSAAVSKTPLSATASSTGMGADRVDTSVLSKLMQRGGRELHAHMQPRPEVVAHWADKLDSPVAMSDAVVQTITRSMVGVYG